MTLPQDRSLQEQLKSLTLLEAAELIKQIEESFGVSAASSVGVGVAVTPTAEAAEKQTEFNVVLESLADESEKIAALRVAHAITGLELKEAKDLVESMPQGFFIEVVHKHSIESLKKRLEEAGSKVGTLGMREQLILNRWKFDFLRLEPPQVSEAHKREITEKEIEIETILTQMRLSDLRIQADQAEIDQLKVDTRKMIANLTSIIK